MARTVDRTTPYLCLHQPNSAVVIKPDRKIEQHEVIEYLQISLRRTWIAASTSHLLPTITIPASETVSDHL